MQIAINPNLYGTAQVYAEQRGLNLTAVIEGFLEQFINTKENVRDEEVPDVVLSLLGSAHGTISENDLNGREAYYHYIEEKYK